MVKLLLDKGADPNITDHIGNTSLHGADRGHKDVVQLLLDRGAETNMANQNTPLHYAVGGGHKDVAQLLLDRGADPNMANQNGNTPLDLARRYGHLDIVIILIYGGTKKWLGDCCVVQ